MLILTCSICKIVVCTRKTKTGSNIFVSFYGYNKTRKNYFVQIETITVALFKQRMMHDFTIRIIVVVLSTGSNI